jgi:MinD superfamily P-loop ATPase
MKEVVIISGKGGTGKTSLVASFAALAKKKVLADCDVDAADLHLILSPSVRKQEVFRAMPKFAVNQETCIRCGKCLPLCRFDAIKNTHSEDGEIARIDIDPISCEGCGVCAYFCPVEAIERTASESGQWFISDTRHGPMVHARLGIAQENSGKLVTIVRKEARRLAEEKELGLVIIDGPPGIGCPVIASITGTDLVLIVTEPTMSGRHDLERAAALAAHFGIQVVVCINKFDLNRENAARTRNWCWRNGIIVVGEVPYDPLFTKAQMRQQSIVEHCDGPTTRAIEETWARVTEVLVQQDASVPKR